MMKDEDGMAVWSVSVQQVQNNALRPDSFTSVKNRGECVIVGNDTRVSSVSSESNTYDTAVKASRILTFFREPGCSRPRPT